MVCNEFENARKTQEKCKNEGKMQEKIICLNYKLCYGSAVRKKGMLLLRFDEKMRCHFVDIKTMCLIPLTIEYLFIQHSLLTLDIAP